MNKEALQILAVEFTGLALFGVGIFDRVNTPTPPYEAVRPDPAYTIVFNAEYRLRSSLLLGVGAGIAIAVPLAALAAVYQTERNNTKI